MAKQQEKEKKAGIGTKAPAKEIITEATTPPPVEEAAPPPPTVEELIKLNEECEEEIEILKKKLAKVEGGVGRYGEEVLDGFGIVVDKIKFFQLMRACVTGVPHAYVGGGAVKRFGEMVGIEDYNKAQEFWKNSVREAVMAKAAAKDAARRMVG